MSRTTRANRYEKDGALVKYVPSRGNMALQEWLQQNGTVTYSGDAVSGRRIARRVSKRNLSNVFH